MSSWPAIEAAVAEFATVGQVSPGVFAAIADRLRTAVEAPDAAKAEDTARRIEGLYRELVAAASSPVREASRGEGDADVLAGYTLGKVAFAQLLAARVADTRADSRFIEHLRDRRYLQLIRALYDEALAVNLLRDKVGERLETVSRKLGALRALGIVVSKKHGNVVVNMLSPAARTLVEQLGLAPVAEEIVPVVKTTDVKQAIEHKREGLKPYMKEAAHFTARDNVVRLPFAERKVA